MKRMVKPEYENKEVKKVDDCLNEIIVTLKRYNLSIGHEDNHGGFIIHEGQNEENYNWLMDASYQKDE